MRENRRFPVRLASAGLIFLVLAGCNFVKAPEPEQETIGFTLQNLPNVTFSVTLTVRDSTTLAVLYQENFTNQTAPFSASYTQAPRPVTVSMAVTFVSFTGTTVLVSGNNGTAGTTTVSDGLANFNGLVLPLIVVDSLASPGSVSDVQSLAAPPPPITSMTVSPAFSGASYNVLSRGQLSGQITRTTSAGTDTQPCYFSDSTLSATFSTSF